jgi:protein-S-isoprenylcysteine O-methyltransferase Ste14
MPPLDPHLVSICLDALWIFWAVCWFVLAFNVKRAVYRQSRFSRLSYFLFAILIVMIASHIVHNDYVFIRETFFTQIAGLILCALGIALAIWARLFLGDNWSGLITLKENHELIRTGPYRFVRHPIYSGLILAAAGSILATHPSAKGILFFLLVLVGLKLKSLAEEKILIPQFPDVYPQYMRDVKALIPFVW